VNQFASGKKRSYYGKGDVVVYRLHRDGQHPPGTCPVFGANVKILIYGDSFWSTYTTGDNTGLIATDSMKNFVQRETLNFAGHDLESYCRFLAAKFLDTYPQTLGAQISATEIPYAGTQAFSPSGPERATACIELARAGVAEMKSGLQGFRLLRLTGSAFHGFVRDQYTTLPDIKDRPLHMWLDLDWTYTSSDAAFSSGAITEQVREIVHSVFRGFSSGSIQQIIYQIGEKMLADVPAIAEIDLEANNRTWDTVQESDLSLGVYTDARPPYGILGLTLTRA
jgi:urate oxidase